MLGAIHDLLRKKFRVSDQPYRLRTTRSVDLADAVE